MTSSSSAACLLYAAAVVVVLHQSCFFTATTTTAAASRIILSNETDRMVLLEFKSKISSDPLGALSSWNDSTHFCHWYGVVCSRRHDGRVRVLNLASQKLSGSITPHIGNLSFLTGIDLSNNSFSEEIPPEIGRLRRLKGLLLFNNSLGGEIPSNISGCAALTKFHVANNKLVGRLPWQVGSLNSLTVFYVEGNNITGGIPPSFGNLSSLQLFFIGENSFNGGVPDSLGQLKSLRMLVMELNNLSGEIPPSIFNLSSLINLSFGENQFHGNLPTSLGISLPDLQIFSAGYNHFTGSVPTSLSNASNLVLLQLQANHFTGILPSLEGSYNLVRFYLFDNNFGSGKSKDLSFFSSLTNATSLKELFVQQNHFQGSLSELIGNMPTSLEMLILYENRFSGGISSGIQNLIHLQVLDANQNNLSGKIPPTIGNVQSLQWLDLSSNKISGFVPSSLGNLTRLLQLNLYSNSLQGEIPVAVGGCRNLIILDLSYNNLSGAIPSQIMGLSSLSILLNLSHNNFTGSLPVEVGSLKNLGSLDLSHNMLSGEMPSSLGSCLRLESLNLEDNFFQGAIPSSLSSLRGIQQLDVSSNNLSGQIPKLFEDMKQLQLLNLSYNNFEGEVPLIGVFKNDSIISVNGNSKLCGGVVQLNLPPCNFRHQKKKILSHNLKILISTIFGLLFFAFTCSCLLILRTKKRGNHDTISYDDSQLQLSYHDLHKATDGFSATNLLGVGGFGSVYKGVLDANGIQTTIAVKVFNLQHHGASKSFMAECMALKNIRHKNLVKILTVCSSVDYQMNDFKALIYQFLANGCLDDWLHPVKNINEPQRSLDFFQRLNISIDVAFAVDYLHHQCGTLIVHCDLKPKNVLLNEDMVAHVGDFGLTRFLQLVANPSSTGDPSSSIGIKGTVGYAPPEYGMGNEVSIKGDVYSYGVLLLEIFSGIRPTDEIFKEGLNIHRFIKSALSEKLIANVVDPILLNQLPFGHATHSNVPSSSNNSVEININKKGQILNEVMISIFEIGVLCSSDSPSERISISEVVARLVSLKKLLRDKFSQRQRGTG